MAPSGKGKDRADASGIVIFPYPIHKSPLVQDSSALDPDWILAAKSNLIFTKQVSLPSDKKSRKKRAELNEEQEAFLSHPDVQQKLDHLQIYFWSALDCARRLEQGILYAPQFKPDDYAPRPETTWHYTDLRGMVNWYRFCFCGVLPDQIESEPQDGMWYLTMLTSPWYHRPEYQDRISWNWFDLKGTSRMYRLLEGDERIATEPEKPVDYSVQERFVRYWWSLVKLRFIRRFPNGALAMPYNHRQYTYMYLSRPIPPNWIKFFKEKEKREREKVNEKEVNEEKTHKEEIYEEETDEEEMFEEETDEGDADEEE